MLFTIAVYGEIIGPLQCIEIRVVTKQCDSAVYRLY